MDLGTENLRFERRGPIAWCTVANPAQRNALSSAMYRGLGVAVRTVSESSDLGALVVTGVDDVFIVGGDIGSHGADGQALSDDELPFDAMYRGAAPVVAAINGHCQASGVWLAVLSDVAVASERARFRLPELRLGVAAPWSSTLLPAVIGLARAKDLALTSRSIDAREAQAMGLISRVVAHEELGREAERAAYELLEAAPEASTRWKRTAHRCAPPVEESAVESSIGTEEAREGFAAFLDRRPPRWSPRHSHALDSGGVGSGRLD